MYHLFPYNYRVAFIGDLHADNQTPISRLDNFEETILQKLRQLKEECVENRVGKVVCTGDFFNRSQTTISFLNKLIKVLNEFKEENIDFYTVIGNHDLPRNNYEFFQNTPLNILMGSGMVYFLDLESPLHIGDNVSIYGLSFNKQEEFRQGIDYIDTDFNVLVAHAVIDERWEEIDKIHIEELNDFNLVVLGHDHTYFKPIVLNNEKQTMVLRSGAFVRRNKKEHSDTTLLANDELKKDNIVYYIVDFESKEIEERYLGKVSKSELVFRTDALLGKNEYDVLNYEELDAIIQEEGMNVSESKKFIYKLLELLEVDERVKKKLIDYLESYL